MSVQGNDAGFFLLATRRENPVQARLHSRSGGSSPFWLVVRHTGG